MIIKTKNYFTMNLLWYIKSLKPRLKDTLILTFSYHREIIKSEVHLQEEFCVIGPCVNIELVTRDRVQWHVNSHYGVVDITPKVAR